MVLNYSFLELGVHLQREISWVTPVAVRSEKICEVDGGWSHMMARYLRLHLLGSQGLMTAGVAVFLFGQPLLIFAKISNILGDGDGLKQLLDWRGAAAIKPCFRHVNIVSKRSHMASQRSAADRGIVDLTCCDHAKMEKAESGYMASVIDMIHDADRRHNNGEISNGLYNEILRTPPPARAHGGEPLSHIAVSRSCSLLAYSGETLLLPLARIAVNRSADISLRW